jgi:hypothetical protein
MTIPKISASDLRRLEDRGHRRKSDAYRYLSKNYQRLLSRKVGTPEGPSWNEVASVMTKRGLVGIRGDPLNGHAVRRVFRRLEHDREKARSKATEVSKALQPMRQRPDWEPPLAAFKPQPVARRVPAPQTRNAATSSAEALPQAGDAAVEAKLAAVKRQFAYLDRHVVQQPDEE